MPAAPESPLRRPLPRSRRVGLAAALTLLCPGWGHLYAGAIRRGLLVALLNVAVIVPGVLWLWVGWVRGPWTAALAFGATLAVLIAVPTDAALCALRHPPRRMRPVRVVLLYGLFVPVSITFLHTELSWIRTNRVQLFQTPTASMVPTLLPGDFFFVDARPGTRSRPDPGDIIVYDDPRRPSISYAKRVVATEGSLVSLGPEGLRVDGVLRTTPSAGPWQRTRTETLGSSHYRVQVGSPGELQPFGPVAVPADHVFVMGDGRILSRDSREFGPLPMERVRGRVVRIFWSWDPAEERVRWSRIGLGFAGMEP